MTKETPTQEPRSTGLSSPDVPVEGIAPCLWFDDQAEEAAKFYTATFPDSSITAVSRYPDSFDNPSGKLRGSVMTVELELAGTPFTALNGGPHFTINPTISFFWHARSVEETERIAAALADGGSYLMELGEYPWSPRYAWVQDRFGVSWQVMTAEEAREGAVVVPCLMFAGDVHGRAEEALRSYADAFRRVVAGGPDELHRDDQVGRGRRAGLRAGLPGDAGDEEAGHRGAGGGVRGRREGLNAVAARLIPMSRPAVA